MCTLKFEKLLTVALLLTLGSTFELPREIERIARCPGAEAGLAPTLLELPSIHAVRQNLRTAPVREPR